MLSSTSSLSSEKPIGRACGGLYCGPLLEVFAQLRELCVLTYALMVPMPPSLAQTARTGCSRLLFPAAEAADNPLWCYVGVTGSY